LRYKIKHGWNIGGVFFGLYLSIYFNLLILESLSLIYFILYFLYFIDNLSKKILILEIGVLLAILTWLIAPLPFFHFFNESNDLAIKWVKVMPIESNEYYSFVLPATIAMMLGFHFRSKYDFILDNTNLNFTRIKEYIKNKKVIGPFFVIVGFFAGLLIPIAPSSLTFVLYLLQKLTYIGLLYMFFQDLPFKNFYLGFGVILLLVHSIQLGMFGDLIHTVILVGSLLVSNRNFSFIKKFWIILFGLFCLLILQSIKHEYRAVAWKQGANSSYFFTLLVERTLNPFGSLDEENTFKYLTRFNQGYLIAKTMYHVPKDKPYAYGETVIKSIAASIVPRLIWPTKPESGGKYNLERFWGFKLSRYSMNIGSIGEAYGNFGKIGGIIFMFFYGLVYKMILNLVLSLCLKRPTWLIWLPFIFLYAIAAETDIVTTTNFLTKTFIFIFILKITLNCMFKMKF